MFKHRLLRSVCYKSLHQILQGIGPGNIKCNYIEIGNLLADGLICFGNKLRLFHN